MVDNVTGPRTDVGTIQVDNEPPVDFPPYKGGANAAYEGANVTGYTTGTPPAPGFLSDLDARGDKAQAKIRTAAVNQARDDSYIGNQLRDDTERHQKQMEESWNAERYAAHDPALRPWNADDEKAKRVRGPMEQFGSVGFIFAMAASAFTRSPMTSALNAGAAAMTSIQEGDEKSYKSAYQAWKDNSDLALKRFDMEHRLYEDANQLLTTDMNLWKTKTAMIAAQFNDQTTLAMLDAGMYPQVVEMKEKLANSAIAVRKAQQGFEEFDLADKLWKEKYAAWKEEHPNASPVEQLQEKMKAVTEAKQAVAGRSVETPEQRFERMMALQAGAQAFKGTEGDKNRESRERVATGQQQNALERAKLSQEGRAQIATMNISAREKLQEYLEGGRMERAEMSDDLRRDLAHMSSEDRKAIEATKEAALKERAEIIFKGRVEQRKVGPASDATFKANEEANQKADKGDFGSPPDLAAMHDWEAKRAQQIIGESKFFPIDQSIIGELKNYPGKDRADLSYIDKSQQTKLNAVFTSRDNLERIAQRAKEHPEAIGYVAELEKRMNLDKYQDLFNKANAGDKNAQHEAVAAVNSEFDKLADGRLKSSQAAEAKIMNKMLTTQAFADAAIAGARGGTIFLDRAFKEIYDQASSPAAFYGVLKQRYIDADDFAKKYGLGFDDRSDKDKQPFWDRFASPNKKADSGAKPTATAVGPGGKRLGLVNGQWVPIP